MAAASFLNVSRAEFQHSLTSNSDWQLARVINPDGAPSERKPAREISEWENAGSERVARLFEFPGSAAEPAFQIRVFPTKPF